MTGLLVSAGLSLFLYAGIRITYIYLPGSVLFLIGLIILVSLLFWMSIKYDHMLDLNEVFSKTISFGMRARTGFASFFLRYMRPLNPYISVLITMLVMLLLLLTGPALIIYLMTYPGPPGALLKICVLFISTGICMLYFYHDRDTFPSIADKLMFITGTLLGTVALINIL
ncbi:MAG: hypothetical protein HZC49_12570 [Nitrospirae bacterium]|nr:hypothetical protein [Nitrospirota bacterium]